MSNLAASYMARRYSKGGKVSKGPTCYSDGGEVKPETETEKLRKALSSPMGSQTMDPELEQYMPPKEKKMSEGGMIDEIESEDDSENIDRSGDLEDEMDNLKTDDSAKKGTLLRKILGGVMKFHKG